MSRPGTRRGRSRARRDPRVVVVTGASSGVGRAVALRLAARGETVVLAARSAETLEEVARACRARGGQAVVVPTDVADEAQVRALADSAVAVCGRIDAWVGAAAVWSYARFEETPPEVFRRVVETTLLGQVHGARAALSHLRARARSTRGRPPPVLVHVASLYGRLSAPYVSPYVAAKWGLVGFSESLRQELRGSGVAVSVVLPGTVDTPIYRHAANRTGHRIRPLPPVVSPERVARVVVRLLDRPRPRVVVGQVQRTAGWLHDVAPRTYDALVGPAVDALTLLDEPWPRGDGTVLAPDPASNAVRDGWRRRDAARGAAGAGLGALGVLAVMALRRSRGG